MGLKTITRVSGKPNVIRVNGEDQKFGSSQELHNAWERLKLNGYVVPKAPTDFMAKWG
ncbi:MAG: hypothetical protein WD512_11525 [Candidatus Paceibacterota bacterium]